MVSAAKSKKVADEKIKAAAIEVVSGKKSVLKAHTELGLDPQGLARGSQFSGSSSESTGKGEGTGRGAGHSGGMGSGAGGSGGSGGGSDGPGGSGESGGGEGSH